MGPAFCCFEPPADPRLIKPLVRWREADPREREGERATSGQAAPADPRGEREREIRREREREREIRREREVQ